MPTITPITTINNGVVVTSRTFYDDFTSTGGGGVSYLNGTVLNKMKAVIDFYTYLSFESKQLVFDSSDKTITNGDSVEGTDFIKAGWRIGQTIEIEGTASNDGTYTIVDVQQRYIEVAEALVDEAADDCSMFDDTPVTAIDFYYNLIENGETENYLSRFDRNAIQRFTATGLDATDTTTVVKMAVNSSSLGWLTNEIFSAITGEVTGVTIVGQGITDHKQYFRIEQEFIITPIWSADLFPSFDNETPPSYFEGSKALKHIVKLDAKYDAYDPDIPFSGGITNVPGLTSWFNQTNNRGRVDYSVASVSYSADGENVDCIDIAKETQVTVQLTSRSGQFDSATKFAVDFFVCPFDSELYTNTDTTLRQNLLNDRAMFAVSDPVEDGEYAGTDYGVLENCNAVITTPGTTVAVVFTVAFSEAAIELLAARNDRYYGIAITTQDEDITSTKQADRVTLLVDFQNAAYTQDDDTLLDVPMDMQIFHYPEATNYETGVAGYEGDPIRVKVPFRVKFEEVDAVRPTLRNVGLQIVLTKDDEDDYVIEQKVFDTTLTRRDCGIQEVDFNETRNYKSYEDDPFNVSSLTRDEDQDTATLAGYELNHAFVLRYEDWLTVIQRAQEYNYPPFNRCGAEVTQAWSTLAADGWEPKLKFVADVEGYDEHVTSFRAYADVEVNAPSDGGYTVETKYYNEVGIEVASVMKGQRTKIVTTFTGDFSEAPTGRSELYAYVFADLPTNGSVTNRRFASTLNDSETDSPFEATNPIRTAASVEQSANLTMNVMDDTEVIVSCWFDDTNLVWGMQNEDILFAWRLGYTLNASVMKTDAGDIMLYEDGNKMLFER